MSGAYIKFTVSVTENSSISGVCKNKCFFAWRWKQSQLLKYQASLKKLDDEVQKRRLSQLPLVILSFTLHMAIWHCRH